MQRGDSAPRFDRARAPIVDFEYRAGMSRRGDEETGPVRPPANPDAFNLHPDLNALPEEFPLTIEINAHPVARLLCSPSHLQELGAGWVFAQGYAERGDDVRNATVRGNRVSVMIDSPGPGGAAWQMLFAAGFDARQYCAPYLNQTGLEPLPGSDDSGAWRMPRSVFVTIAGEVFASFRDDRAGGGRHFAGATDGQQMSPVFCDVCRHNAVDKVVGWSLLRRASRERHALCLSGRVSAAIMVKAWRAGFPVVATRSIPTAEAVGIAHVAGISIVGRVLDGRRTVYSHPWRFAAGD